MILGNILFFHNKDTPRYFTHISSLHCSGTQASLNAHVCPLQAFPKLSKLPEVKLNELTVLFTRPSATPHKIMLPSTTRSFLHWQSWAVIVNFRGIINFIRIICDTHTRWKQRNASHNVLHGKGRQMLITFCEPAFPTIMTGINKRLCEIGFSCLSNTEWPLEGVVQ